MICYRFFMTLFYRDKLPIMRPSQGFGGIQGEGLSIFRDLGRRVIYLRDLGRKHNFLEFKGAGG